MNDTGYRRGLCIVAFSFLLSACSSLLFYPDRTMVTTPADWNLDHVDVFLRTPDDTMLHGWWLPAKGEARGTVYFLHGNAENISTHIANVAWMPKEGFNVFLLDYRGYGRSDGEPDIPAVFMDIETGLDWVADKTGSLPLIFLGQSLGASTGGYVLASRVEHYPQLAAVILDSAFTGYRAIAREVAARSWLTWALQPLVAAAMPAEYDLVDVVDRFSPVPVLIIHGNNDEVIPAHHGEELFEAAREPKSFLRYDGPHIGTFGDKENRALVVEFIERSVERWRERPAP